jgi:hypothetical protein
MRLAYIAGLAGMMALAGAANSAPMATVTVDPVTGAVSSSVDGIICPTALPCAENGFQNPGGTPGSLYFRVDVASDGHLDLAIDLLKIPEGSSGTANPLAFQVYDAETGGTALGGGSLGTPLSLDVFGGQQFFVFVQYGYFGGRDNQRALWQVRLDTEALPQSPQRVIPEPGTVALLGLAALGLFAARRLR